MNDAEPTATHTDPFQTYADELLARAEAAMEAMRGFGQEQVDRIVEATARAAFDARIDLAKLACEETGMGVLEHKIWKNAWASLIVHEDLVGRRTVGDVWRDETAGIVEIAEPVGPIVALTPVTNPTSTVITKILFCLKTRNAVIFSPHRGARRCTREAGRVLMEAAVAAGAPAEAVQWITKPQSEALDRVMRHRATGLILATGTSSIVRTAQATGKPTIGVGPGNVPVYVHASADLQSAAACIFQSKTFDQGTVCASEQTVVVDRAIAAELQHRLVELGAYMCNADQTRALGPICFDAEKRSMRAEVVGQPAARIAELAGFEAPVGTKLLLAALPFTRPSTRPSGRALEDEPLAHEILAPVLGWIEVEDHFTGRDACAAILSLGGAGHTLGLHTTDPRVIDEFEGLPAGRILLNTPTTEGAIGGAYNRLRPSLTLTCGAHAGNDRLDNISVEHLIQIRRVVDRRDNGGWFGIEASRWSDPAFDATDAFTRYRSHRG